MTSTRRHLAVLVAVLAVATPAVMAGCKKIERVDTHTDINLSGDWNDADAKQTADALVASCLKSPWNEDFQKARGRKPVVKVGRVIPRTNGDIVNPALLSGALTDALTNSGKAEVVADSAEAEQIRAERTEQERNASEATRKESFQEVGADFLLTGEINVQDDQADGEKVKYYKTSLRLVDITTGKRVWSDSHDLKKLVSR